MQRTRHNPYNGVNAHLHSLFEFGIAPAWTSFHHELISSIVRHLNRQLPDGYYAEPERTITIQRLDSSTPPQRRRPDITVMKQAPVTSATSATSSTASPTATRLLHETLPMLDEEQFGVVIYRDADTSAVPVCRLEVLSPSNMYGGGGYGLYQQNRVEVIQSRIPLVEVDLLHALEPPLDGLPQYPTDADAYPYSLYVTDARLPRDKSAVFVYGVGIDVPLPALAIPLDGAAAVSLNFQVVYDEAFVTLRYGQRRILDYSTPPERFETYRADDQAAIERVMQRTTKQLSDD